MEISLHVACTSQAYASGSDEWQVPGCAVESFVIRLVKNGLGYRRRRGTGLPRPKHTHGPRLEGFAGIYCKKRKRAAFHHGHDYAKEGCSVDPMGLHLRVTY